MGLRTRLQAARLLAPHRPWHRPRRPRAREPGARRDHAAGAVHVLQQRTRALSTREVRYPAGGLLPHGREGTDLVLDAAGFHRQAVWMTLLRALACCMALAGIAAAGPQMHFHRKQAGDFKQNFWVKADSTEGRFSVLMPVPFNDF